MPRKWTKIFIHGYWREAQNFLLILGEPGSGKTITLLELAESLLEQGQYPVWFNLSSWAQSEKPLLEWMQAEMRRGYGIHPDLSLPLLQGQHLLPLLDGLDEVAETKRPACVAAINAFAEEYGLGGLAVCCRVEEYAALAREEKLHLRGAVCLQALDEAQISAYLDSFGDALQGLRTLFTEDPELRDLARSPLLLNIMSLAYHEVPAEAIRAEHAGDMEQRRAGLFERYIARMFERRGGDQPFPKDKTLEWLGWLAGRMQERSQSVFYLEGLQPGWLQNPEPFRLLFGISIGLLAGILLGLVVGLLEITKPTEWVLTVIIGLPAGFYTLSFFIIREEEIKLKEQICWSWKKFRHEWLKKALWFGWIGGWFLGLFFGLFGLLVKTYTLANLFVLLISAIFFGVLFGTLFGLLEAGQDNRSLPDKRYPNQGVHATLKNTLNFGWVWIVLGVPILVWVMYITSKILHLFSPLVIAASTGFGQFGGITALQHYTLRLGACPRTHQSPYTSQMSSIFFNKRDYIFIL